MSAIIIGIANTQIIANPNFRAKKDGTGKWTATQSYQIKRGDYGSVAEYFQKGVTIPNIYPDVQDYFAPLIIEDHEYQEQPGGMDSITVSFVGWQEGTEGQTERETVYEYSVDIAERPIVEHPKFIEMSLSTPDDAAAIVRCFNETARCENLEAQNPRIIDNFSADEITIITDPNPIKWFDMIFRRGVKTYLEPIPEYTETKTDQGGLSNSKVADLGKIDSPPNSPPTPSGKVWILSGASETRSSDNPVTYTRKWTVIDDTEDNNILYD
jgi:hypothetical protein